MGWVCAVCVCLCVWPDLVLVWFVVVCFNSGLFGSDRCGLVLFGLVWLCVWLFSPPPLTSPPTSTLCQGRELYLLFAALVLSFWELENLKERLKPLGEGSSGKFSDDQAAALQGCEGAPHD